MEASLPTFLQAEAQLISEAAEALPHQFSSCTYTLGHIRQAVYLCLTCNRARGVCSSCSVACHTDHEQIELFPKRNFRCDCPSSALSHPCTLYLTQEPENASNEYGQNFKGSFCRCGRPYVAKRERETMIQCLACEDWFHESCLNLRERPPSRPPSPDPAEAAQAPGDDSLSEASSSGLPPPHVAEEQYDSMICRSCIIANPTLRKWAGTKGAMMVYRPPAADGWKVLDGDTEEDGNLSVEIDNQNTSEGRHSSTEAVVSGSKRRLDSPASEETSSKRVRVAAGESKGGSSPCLAPSKNPLAQAILNKMILDPTNNELGSGDVFFTEGWRERWCRCEECLPPLQAQPYLLEEEDTYEPPVDPDSESSLEELGMRALQNLPQDHAVNGILAYNSMRDELLQFLRPFAEEGKVVGETDVRQFFEEKMEALQSRQRSRECDF